VSKRHSALRTRYRLTACAMALFLSDPAWGYDLPLSSSVIRDAYFLGRRQAGMGNDFLAQYRHSIPRLGMNDSLITRVRIETPFLQVAQRAAKTLNYNAQDAVKDFYDKLVVFRMSFVICYMVDAPAPNSVKIAVSQNGKQILPQSDERYAFSPATDPHTPAVDAGETAEMTFDARKFDSSTLTI
jgi:hypothetical protein